MKSVLISLRPKWCDLTASGEKTIEARKTAPKEVPFKGYIYATRPKKYYKCGAVSTSDELLWLANGKIKMCDGFEFWANGEDYQCVNGKVIGEFVCYNVDEYTFSHYNAEYRVTHVEQKGMCLNQPELILYGKGKTLYGWHISDLKIYDKPRELSEFAVADKEAIRQCEYREQSYYAFTDTGYIKNGFYCKKKDDWCFGECKRKALTRPPQSWCYVEVYK